MGACAGGYPRRVPEIRAATVDDAGQVFELLDARSRAAFGSSEVSRPLVEAELRRSVADRFVATDGNGRLVGYGHLSPANDVVVATADANIAAALLERIEERGQTRGVVAVEASVAAEDRPFHTLVEQSGFSHTRSVLRMWRVIDDGIPAAAGPDDVTVRTYEDAYGERVKKLLDDAYAWDDQYAPQSYDKWVTYMTDHDEFDPSLWFLAERDGELVACALHWREQRRRGWLKDLAVHERARGAGLGKALIRHGLHAYAERGVERVGLKVDDANPTGAIDLYLREGFVTDQRLEIWRKSL
jgi:mycothiol synthase